MSAPNSSLDVSALETARRQMIAQQLRTWEVLDNAVLEALHVVKREEFVPEPFRQVAFADEQIPLGHGQFMLQPKLDGRILQTLSLRVTDEVLDIGAGSGFLASCMGKLAARVRSLEIFPDVAERARRNVHNAAANNVVIDTGDATQLVDENRYDAIAITCAIPPNNDSLERRFERALKVGGRMFMVVGSTPIMEAVLITRTTQSHWGREKLFETVVEPLVNAARPSAFAF
jgi:protein-L-isoaspartate(D-aspartate) O-methyltransferase